MYKRLTEKSARTNPEASDPALLGRTYAIPFDTVWRAALLLAHGGLRGWKLISSDDELGIITVDVRAMLVPLEAKALVSVTLDADGQTRVDMSARGVHRWGDFGVNRRRIRTFFRVLDRELSVRPDQIVVTWSQVEHVA